MKVEDLKVDDVLVAKDGVDMTVLAVCGKIRALSFPDDSTTFYEWYTVEEIVNAGFEIKKKLTLADKFPEGEMLLGRGSVRLCWCVTFSTGRINVSGNLICRVERDKASAITLWDLVRPFDRDLIGAVTK